jgi:hypothetical protein
MKSPASLITSLVGSSNGIRAGTFLHSATPELLPHKNRATNLLELC